MKKFFFIAAIASAALVSCTKNEVAPVAFEQEITFAAPVVGPQTKAPQYGEIPVAYNENESFGVYAVHTSGDFATWAGGSLYMGETAGKGLKCSKAAGKNYWAPEVSYYWPKEGKLSFAAYSPYELSGTVTYGTDGLSVVNHQVSINTAEHVDFMYAERVYNYTSSTEETTGDNPYYTGVDIDFKHAMSSIVFRVARDGAIDENTKITLNKITLAKPYMAATFSEGITNEAVYASTPVWDGFSAKQDIITYNTPKQITKDLTEYVNNTDDDIILIPQKIENDVKVVLDYTITNPGGHSVHQVSSIQLNTTGTTEWVIGKRYIYNITIGLEEIKFDPAVLDWTNAPEINIAK